MAIPLPPKHLEILGSGNTIVASWHFSNPQITFARQVGYGHIAADSIRLRALSWLDKENLRGSSLISSSLSRKQTEIYSVDIFFDSPAQALAFYLKWA